MGRRQQNAGRRRWYGYVGWRRIQSRTESTRPDRPDIGDELTVIRQVRRCLAVQTLVNKDSDFEQYSLSHG